MGKGPSTERVVREITGARADGFPPRRRSGSSSKGCGARRAWRASGSSN